MSFSSSISRSITGGGEGRKRGPTASTSSFLRTSVRKKGGKWRRGEEGEKKKRATVDAASAAGDEVPEGGEGS